MEKDQWIKNVISFIFGIIAIILSNSLSQSQIALEIDNSKKGNDTILIEIKIAKRDIEIEHLNIYIDEKFTLRFPDNRIKQFSREIPYWNFIKRESFSFLGFDLRKPGQLSKLEYWTPGEVYTIGVEAIYYNEDKIRNFTYVFPFEIIDKKPNNEKKIRDIPLKEKNLFLPKSSAYFISENDEFYIPQNKDLSLKKTKITYIAEYLHFYLISLSDERNIKYDKPVKRPDFLGDKKLIFIGISTFLFVLIILIILYLYFHSRSVKYLKEMESENIDDKIIILKRLLSEKNAIVILHMLAHNSRFNVDEFGIFNNKLKVVLKKFKPE